MDELINYNGYEEFKQAVNRVLNRTVEDFVLTGYLLKQARDTDILKDSGYNDVNEFAWGEYKLDASQVSRYIRVNDKFSEGGYSPKLQEQYQGFGYAKLALMEIKEKLKHWFIMVSTNRCLGCCLFCEWWNMCKWETEDRRKKS